MLFNRRHHKLWRYAALIYEADQGLERNSGCSEWKWCCWSTQSKLVASISTCRFSVGEIRLGLYGVVLGQDCQKEPWAIRMPRPGETREVNA